MGTGRFRGADARYRRLIARRGAARFFAPAAAARLGVAMSGLAVFWAVHGSAGSFADAGAAAGVFALADAVVGPQFARLIDRWGQSRVLPFGAAAFLASAGALVVAASPARPVPAPVLIALAAVAGATAPPIGALSAARWRRILGPAGLLATALSVEGALNDATFLVGPVLVTSLGVAVAPEAGLVLACGLVSIGVLGMLLDRASEPRPSARPAGGTVAGRRPRNPRVLALVAANVALGFFFGGIGVVLTAFAFAQHAAGLTGWITAGSGAVSLVTGLGYGGTGQRHPGRVMLVAGTAITVGCALLAFVPDLPAMFLGYAGVGGCVALVVNPSSVLLQRSVSAAVYTQAMAWINSASAVGVATAAPVIGALVQHAGWQAGFLGLAAMTAALPLVVAASSRLFSGRR